MNMLKELKLRTQAAHKNAEDKSLAHKIINNRISLEEYKDFLLKQFQFYTATEQFITKNKEAFPKSFEPFISNKKSAKLTLDLEQNFNTKTLSIPLKNIDIEPDFENLLGMLYVIEGSMMGSMLIQKQLPNCENLKSIKTHYFFHLNPKEQLAKWKKFQNTVNNISFTENQVNKAIKSANYTFDLVDF